MEPQNLSEPIETHPDPVPRTGSRNQFPEPVPGTRFFPGTAPARREHTEIYIVQRPHSILLLGKKTYLPETNSQTNHLKINFVSFPDPFLLEVGSWAYFQGGQKCLALLSCKEWYLQQSTPISQPPTSSPSPWDEQQVYPWKSNRFFVFPELFFTMELNPLTFHLIKPVCFIGILIMVY